MRSKTNLLAYPYEPFGGIILIPSDGITVVHGKLVMEVMIPFTDGHESSDEMVARGMLVVERRFSKPVRERVDAKCRLHKSKSVKIFGGEK
jgi:hypothetical protein